MFQGTAEFTIIKGHVFMFRIQDLLLCTELLMFSQVAWGKILKIIVLSQNSLNRRCKGFAIDAYKCAENICFLNVVVVIFLFLSFHNVGL